MVSSLRRHRTSESLFPAAVEIGFGVSIIGRGQSVPPFQDPSDGPGLRVGASACLIRNVVGDTAAWTIGDPPTGQRHIGFMGDCVVSVEIESQENRHRLRGLRGPIHEKIEEDRVRPPGERDLNALPDRLSAKGVSACFHHPSWLSR